MKYLLDVNALIALGLFGHAFHPRVTAWLKSEQSPGLLACSITAQTLAAFYLPAILFVLGIPVASAQCSQARQPQSASSAQLRTNQQTSPPVATSSESASSSGTASDVRFATGSAITVLENTPIQVVTDAPISSRTAKAGAKFPFTVTQDVTVGGVLVIPCGARVYGTVISAKKAGRLTGTPNLALELTELNLDGKTYPLYTPQFKVVGQSKTKSTVKKVATGAAVGGLGIETVMDVAQATSASKLTVPVTVADHAQVDSVVAGMGAGVGAAIAAVSPPAIALIPAESQLEFTLASPVAVFPVDQPTAQRLARGMFPGGPVLYLRGDSQ